MSTQLNWKLISDWQANNENKKPESLIIIFLFIFFFFNINNLNAKTCLFCELRQSWHKLSYNSASLSMINFMLMLYENVEKKNNHEKL